MCFSSCNALQSRGMRLMIYNNIKSSRLSFEILSCNIKLECYSCKKQGSVRTNVSRARWQNGQSPKMSWPYGSRQPFTLDEQHFQYGACDPQ
jgi:hypothetical protein